MPRDYIYLIEDMLKSTEKIRRYVKGHDFGKFCADEQLVDAVVRNLEIIGEASKNIPAEVRKAHPEIDWKKVGAFRDVLAHSYFGVDLQIVWDIVENKLPDLRKNLAKIR